MNKIVLNRYAIDGNNIFREVTTFVKVGSYEGTVENDPRAFFLLGQTGKWLWFLIDGFLGDESQLKSETHPYEIVLREGLKLITKEEYEFGCNCIGEGFKENVEVNIL